MTFIKIVPDVLSNSEKESNKRYTHYIRRGKLLLFADASITYIEKP
jgi:hypothetical protein